MLFHGPVPIGYLMAFGALWGLATAFEMPARQTLMVELVGKPDLVNAIALNSAMVNSTRIIGPAVGGLLLASVGAAWCFLLDALSYLAVLYGLHRIQLPPEHYAPKAAPNGWGHLLEGFRYLRQARSIAIALAMMAVVGVAGWAYQSQMAAFAKIQLGAGPWTYSWLLCMNGLGACAAALLVAFQGGRLVRVRTLYGGVALYGCAIILFGLARQAWLAGALLFFAGAGLILFFSVGNSLVQSQSPDHLRGRLMGLWALVFGGGMPLGSFWMGLLASRTSPGFALQLGGLGCLLGAAAVWAAFRRGAPKEERRHPVG
jgi:predicted MFS family arabinose efflux permease